MGPAVKEIMEQLFKDPRLKQNVFVLESLRIIPRIRSCSAATAMTLSSSVRLWVQADSGQWIRIFALNLADWTAVGDAKRP